MVAGGERLVSGTESSLRECPDSSYLLPTRPPRRPAPYASDTSPGVTPPSGPRLISVCVQPSPRARRSVGVVEHVGSRFPRLDPPPWWGRRGYGAFSTSRECPPSVTPTPYPRPFRHLSMLPWWPWHRSSWDPVDSPLVRNLASLVPSSLSLLWWQPSPRLSPIVYLRCPIICLQLDAISISLNVPSPVVCRMRPPDLACLWA